MRVSDESYPEEDHDEDIYEEALASLVAIEDANNPEG